MATRTFTSAALTADRTVTWPDETFTVGGTNKGKNDIWVAAGRQSHLVLRGV